MARPRTSSTPRAKRFRPLTVEFAPDLRVSIDVTAAHMGISAGKLVRQAVAAYLEQLQLDIEQNLAA